MKAPGRPVRILAALGMGAALVVGGAAGPAMASSVPAAATTQSVRDVLMGTWVGTFAGFDGNTFSKGIERIQITTVRGSIAKGTWQSRDTAADQWSAKSPLLFVALPDAGGWKVTGADGDGIYVGTLDTTGTTLDLAYQGSVSTLMAYHFVMKKQ